MTAWRALFAAYVGVFLIGLAAALALFHRTSAASLIGLIGAVLDIAALIWLLRKEVRR